MSFRKYTYMRIGNKTISRDGYWKLESCKRLAAKIGGNLSSIEHCIFDMSGKGRSGHDGLWEVDDNGNLTQVEKWRECEERAFGTVNTERT